VQVVVEVDVGASGPRAPTDEPARAVARGR
jgi:hypothetical protein